MNENNNNLNFLFEFALDTYSKERSRTDSLDTKLSVCISLVIALLTASFSALPLKTILSKLPQLSNGCLVLLIIGIILFIIYLLLIGLTCFKLFLAFKTKRFYSINAETFTNEEVYSQPCEKTLKYYINDLGNTISTNREINDFKAKTFDSSVLLMMISAISFVVSLFIIKLSIYL